LSGNAKFSHVNFWISQNLILVLQPNLFFALILGGNANFSLVNFWNSRNLILVLQPNLFFALILSGNANFWPVNFWNSDNVILVLQPALFFQQFWGWNFNSCVFMCLVMKIYKLVLVVFGSDSELAPSTKNYCFSGGKGVGLVSQGIVTTVLRETRKLSGCFKIKNLQPSNTNNE